MSAFLAKYTTHFYVIMYLVLAFLCAIGWRRTRQAGFAVLFLWAVMGLTAGATQQFGTELVFGLLSNVFSPDTATRVMTGSFSLMVIGLMGLLTLGVGLLACGRRSGSK